MPVRQNSFKALAKGEGINFPNESYRALYRVLATLHAESEFVTQPAFPEYGAMEKQFSTAFITIFGSNRGTWFKARGNPDDLTTGTLAQIKKQLSLTTEK